MIFMTNEFVIVLIFLGPGNTKLKKPSMQLFDTYQTIRDLL